MWCWFITLSIRIFDEAGSTRPLARLMIMSRKLLLSSTRRGFTSFQISGHTFFRLGLGREAVSAEVVALPTPREGRSPDGIPPLKLDALNEEDMKTFLVLPKLQPYEPAVPQETTAHTSPRRPRRSLP